MVSRYLLAVIENIAPRHRLAVLIMISRYRSKPPIRAILEMSEGQKVPAGAVLYKSSQPSTTLIRMVGVAWGGRHYSVYSKDLKGKTEWVSVA